MSNSKWLIKQRELEQDDTHQQIIQDVVLDHPSEPTNADQLYMWVAGDNIWQVSRRLGFEAKELLEHNDIEDHNEIQPGHVLHLPSPRPLDDRQPATYEVLSVPKKMHVSTPEGVKKWSFAYPQAEADLFTTGQNYKPNTNVWIVARANVPIGDTVHRFYMDALAVGNYLETGRVSYTIGFKESDLSDGHVSGPAPLPLPDDQLEVILQAGWDLYRVLSVAGYPHALAIDPSVQRQVIVQDDPDKPLELVAGQRVRVVKYIEPETVEAPEEPEPDYPNDWKSTYSAFIEPVLFYATQTIMVREFDSRRPDKELQKNQPVYLAGIFYHDNTEYGRPTGAAKAGYWFGIPTESLISDEELYNTELDLPGKVALHNDLTWQEQTVVAVSRVLSRYTQLKSFISNRKKG